MTEKQSEVVDIRLTTTVMGNVEGIILLIGSDIYKKIEEEQLNDFFERIGRDIDNELLLARIDSE